MANKNKLMEKAQKFLQKGKLKDTVLVLNQVIELDPTDYRVLLKKGELEQRIGDDAAAKESYTQVAEQYSSDGFYLKAIAIYKKILKLDPNELQIHSKLALLYRKLGLDSEAKKHLKVAAEYYKIKGLKTNYQEIVNQLSEMGESFSDIPAAPEQVETEGNRDQAIDQLRKLSQKAFESKSISQLDAISKKMEELNIREVDMFILHAKTFIAAKEPKKALQSIQKAYAIQPQNSETLELLAQCFIALTQPQKAISVFNELVKIYDIGGDMKNLARIKAELMRLVDPVDELNEDDGIEVEEDHDSSYKTVNRDESEEFVIEEVEVVSPPKVIKKSEPVAAPKVEAKKPVAAPVLVKNVEVSEPSSKEESVFNFDDFDDDEKSFTRSEEPANPNEMSFMNVFVDQFDGNEETVLFNSESDIQKKSQEKFKTEQKQPLASHKTPSIDVPLDLNEEMESSIDFQSSNAFEESSVDLSEPTRLEMPDLSGADFNEIEPTRAAKSEDVASVNFEDAGHDATVLDAPSTPSLVDFDQFYSGESQEKSEISVHEEEFVSISELGEPSIPQSKPEKIEIHDVVLTPRAPAKPLPTPPQKIMIKQVELESGAVGANVESTLDFSNLEMSEINLSVPENSVVNQELVNSMLSDPEPEPLEKQIQLDEKTMLDVQQEFKESARNEPVVEDSDNHFFDLSSELKDEISEFEKSFGSSDEDAEEEYLSPEEVILEFKKGIARTIDKTDYQTHYNLGVAYKEMGLIDEAISAFELASVDPQSKIDAVSMIGICMVIKNDHESAIKLYQQTLSTMSFQDPKALGLNYQLAEAFLEVGRHVEAYKAFARIKDIDPSFRDVRTRLKELAFNLGIKEDDMKQHAGKMIVDLKERKKNKI